VLSRGTEVVLAVVVERGCATGPMLERRRSWMPGADGAPVEVGLRWLWVLEWELGGAILIACKLY
jgi:hypothetical protein